MRSLPFWATFLTLCAVIILCALGTWQLQRLEWKNNIIAKLDKAYASKAANINFNALENNDFAYGSVTGTFLFNKSIALGHRVSKESVAGHSLITPLKTEQGTLLINMGFNPNDQPIRNHFLNAYQGQNITFTGLARSPSWNIFTPENNPENDTWYKYDIDQIAQKKNLENPIPFILYADSASLKFDASFPSNERWYPKNNHAQYAFFWFTLAGTLIIIYILRFGFKKA